MPPTAGDTRGWYPQPDNPDMMRWWNGKKFEGDPRQASSLTRPSGAPKTAPTTSTTSSTPTTSTTSPAPATTTKHPNPIGLGVALLGAALVIIGSFVDVHTYGSLPIQKNSFVAGGQWWILVAGVALGVAAVTPLVRIVSNAVASISVAAVIAVAGGIYGLSASFQTLALNPAGQELLGGASVKGTPGAGVYLVLAGGIIGVVGGLLTLSPKAVVVPVSETPVATARTPKDEGIAGELERLASLHTQGVLSDEEFADAKRRALRDAH